MPPVGTATMGIQLQDKGKGKRTIGDAGGIQLGQGKGKKLVAGIAAGAGVGGERQSSTQAAFEMPWVEKYRPKLIKDVMGNSEAVKRLKVIAEQGNIPNLLLAGSPGTGTGGSPAGTGAPAPQCASGRPAC